MPSMRKRTSGSEKNNGGEMSRFGDSLDLTLYSQGDDIAATIYFVLPTGTTEATCPQNLTLAYHLCLESGINGKWISEKECTEWIPVERNVFVLHTFEGGPYQHLMTFYHAIKFEIVGPQCVRMSLECKDDVSIRNKGHPMFTLAMKDIVVTMSGFTEMKAEKEELEDLIRKMNGTVSGVFTLATTHIVTASLLTEKCYKAYENEKPVMRPEWVRAVWQDSESDLIQATDPKYVACACPIFFNLTICVSQVPSAKKNALKNIIEANGGSYSNELVKGFTKVLVIPAGQGGEKHRYACQWGLPCVTPNWIERCKMAGHILDVSDFRVQGVADLRTSTPTKRKISKFPDASMNMCSIIPNASRTEIEATYCSMKNDSVASNIDSDALNIVKKANDEGPFLDGCKIYLCGSDTMEQVRKLLNSSGATRLNGLNETVTHVLVLGSKIPDNDANRIQRLNPKPYLVKIDWLIESAKQGSPADEDMFAFEQNNGKQMLPPSTDPRSKNTIDLPLAQLTIHELVEKNNKTPPIAKSQGTPKQKDGQVSVIAKQTLDENNLTYDADSTHVSRSLKKQSVPLQECQPNNTSNTIVEDCEDSTATEAPFQGMKFAINLTVLGEKNDIEEMICDMRGSIAEDNYDTIILPVVYTRDMNTDNKECFTKYWVLDCNEARTINIPKVQYHHPLLSFKGIRNVLKSVVIAVSQYGNSEKSYLATLAIAMGAEYQDVFARKTTPTTLRSTHLICSVPENDKCFAAKRWGVPVVTADWIYECFEARKVLSVENYFPGSSKKNSSDSTISYIPVTPKAPNGTMNKVAERLTALTSHIGTSFYPPSTSKAIKNVLPANGFKASEVFKRVAQTERTPSSSACNSDSDSQTTPNPTRRVSKPDYDTSLDLVPAKPVEESPIIPGLSREGSRQLKRALDNICSNSPGPDYSCLAVQKKIETRDSVIMGSIWADLAAKYPKRNRNARGQSQNQLPFVRVSLNNDAANSHPPDEPLTEENNLISRRSRSPLVTVEDDVRPKKRRTNESSQSDDPEPDIPLNMEVVGADVDMEDDDDYNMRDGTRNNLMCNIVVFISKKCEDIKTLTDMIKNMGGQVTTELKSSELTHLVYQGKNAHMSKEVKSVANSGVQVVDPLWVYKCQESNSLLNENMFLPGTAKLSNECTDSNESNVPSSKLSLDALNNMLQNQVVELPNTHDDSSDSTQRKAFKYQKLKDPKGEDDDSEEEDEHNEADNLEQAGCSSTNGNSKKKSEESDNMNQKNIPDKFVEPEILPQLPKNSKEIKDDVIVVDSVKTVTNVTMTTRTRSTRSRSAALSNEVNATVANTKTRMTRQKVSNENITEVSERRDFAFSSKPIFMLSALPESVKPLALNTITKLGGLVSQEAVFDPNAEATIAGSLARSEKVLGSVAAGKPILPIAYIHACSKENQFLPPNDFLWSAKDAKNELENQVVAAANFWLERITNNPMDKPYAQYRIFLCAKKCDPLSRLILSGGGTVVNKLEEANMIVGDKDMTKKYESANIPIHTSTFLSSVLFNFLPSSS